MEKILKGTHIREELRDHLPYSFGSTLAGIGVLGIFSYLMGRAKTGVVFSDFSVVLFHFFHPLHVFFSATTAAAMFGRHERNFFKSIGVGVAGSVIPCVLSDILFPYVGGRLFGIPMVFHLDFVIHPFWMTLILFGGILTGSFISERVARSTLFSHSIHVFISTMATLTYLTGFGPSGWAHYFLSILVIGILSVILPCCFGDIVVPHLFTEKVHRHS